MTIEEIKNISAEECEARIAEIKNEMNDESADIEALSAEVDAIEERKTALINAEEQRKALAQKVASDVTAPIVEERKEEKKMENIEIRNTAEYIDAFANYIKSGKDEECRALLTENVSGSVPVPEFVYDIVKTAWEREGIMSRVRKAYVKGNLKVGFEYGADPAYVHTEGDEAVAEETLTLGVVTLVPASIKKWITISDEVVDMKGEAFLRYIYDELTYQIAKKAEDELIAKIKACGTVSTNTPATNVAVPVVVNTGTLSAVADAISELSDKAADPVIMMNKKTYSTFKALQYAANYPVDPFEGLDVLFNDTIVAFDDATTGVPYAIIGDLGVGALANFPEGDGVSIKYDDLSLAEYDLVKIVGREYIGMGVVAPKAFVKLVKDLA